MEKLSKTTFGRVKKPIPVIIFALILFLGSIYSIAPVLSLFSGGNIFIGGLMGVLAFANIVTAVGLLKMKRWALYSYTVCLFVEVSIFLYFSFVTSQRVFPIFLIILPGVGALIYFWSISKKFVS